MKDYSVLNSLLDNAKLLLETAYDKGYKQEKEKQEKQTIPEIIEEVKCEMCDNYCKYPDVLDDDDRVIRSKKMGDYIIVRTRECKICSFRYKTREIIREDKDDTNRTR